LLCYGFRIEVGMMASIAGRPAMLEIGKTATALEEPEPIELERGVHK